MSTEALFAAIDAHFLAPDALRRAELFARTGRSSAEGWFKGELMQVLESSKAADSWRPDVPIAKDHPQRCDFRIVAGGQPLWLEVKTVINPAQAANEFGGLGRGAGFADDLVKLLRVSEGDRAVLLFVLPRPDPAQWSELLATYQRRIAPIGFRELTAIEAYPAPLYVCKLELVEAF